MPHYAVGHAGSDDVLKDVTAVWGPFAKDIQP